MFPRQHKNFAVSKVNGSIKLEKVMKPNRLRQLLKEGRVLLGLAHTYSDAGLLEGMGQGWDFVWLDGQHGQHTYQSLLHAVRTAETLPLATIVRVPAHSWEVLGQYADLAPDGLMLPFVNKAEQAQAIVEAVSFPPLGYRSYGGRRVVDRLGRRYYLDDRLLLVVQIETMEAVENADKIAAVEGVDVLFVGPDDLKVQLGLPIDTPAHASPQIKEIMHTVAEAARKNGKFWGCPAIHPDDFQLVVKSGAQLVVAGIDVYFLKTGANAKLKECQSVLAAQGKAKATP